MVTGPRAPRFIVFLLDFSLLYVDFYYFTRISFIFLLTCPYLSCLPVSFLLSELILFLRDGKKPSSVNLLSLFLLYAGCKCIGV